MMKVTIRIVGRPKSEKWIEEACGIYQKRLKGGSAQIDVSTEWYKSNDSLLKAIENDLGKNFKVILLDPRGADCTSEQFATKFYRWMEDGGSRLVFVVGGGTCVSYQFLVAGVGH